MLVPPISTAIPIVVLLLVAATPTAGLDSDLFFILEEHSERCFFEQLPASIILLGDYKNPDASSEAAKVNIYAPNGQNIYSEALETKGRFAHRSVVAGNHKICFSKDETKGPWRTPSARVHLKLELHGSDDELEKSAAASGAKKEHLSSLEAEIENLDNQVDLVLKDIQLSKTQETHFREQSERINSRIMWWSLFQTLLLLLSSVWMILHLKQFFKAKKLV